ncbi:putative diphthamide synthesis protein-domain-containing protein [Flammula alnicola]|nr:putative diphthamide synthesis protein-domain-containing protein [Flammula alnicola]
MSSQTTTSFSSSGEDAITRTIDIRQDDIGPSNAGIAFPEFYEIERTAEELVKGGYKRIALQFPDELLHDSVPIFRHLKRRIAELRQKSSSTSASISSSKPSPPLSISDPISTASSQLPPNANVKEDERDPELYVLADTSYGSCCVDEVAAQHVNADALVHYGHACMTLTSRLPVIYVFGQKKLAVEPCVAELLRAFDAEAKGEENEEPRRKQAVLLKHDVVYTHLADTILHTLREVLAKREKPILVLYDRIPTSTHPVPSTAPEADAKKNKSSAAGEEDTSTNITDKPKSETEPEKAKDDEEEDGSVEYTYTAIFYIGGESLGLTNLLMTNAGCQVYTYDPRTLRAVLASGRTNRLLMRRYAAVQKARDADVFGILVGTLGVASYLPLISHLRRLLARQRKKSYTISVGKLNPAKLANFLEVECFVLVACPENSLVEGEKDFLRPIVTPYELEVALQAEQSWTGRYVLDFGRLLADAKAVIDDSETTKQSTIGDGGNDNVEEGGSGDGDGDGDESDPDQPVFSLVTGTYRHAKRYGGKNDTSDDERLVQGTSAMVLRNQDNQIARMDSAAGQFLQQRTYHGLELRIGEDAPSVLEQGRSGIARGYQDDRAHQDMSSD